MVSISSLPVALHLEQPSLSLVCNDPAPGWEISANSVREQVLLFEAAPEQSLREVESEGKSTKIQKKKRY